ncbi:MAG: hypothetical protein JO262_11505 [Solirubrobacterales bacterium]|nr:hypothetical protein [Solirubrobacterales bacterium]MBV9942745.1 hypothetical protein [Solirubrobacterales bacterium]
MISFREDPAHGKTLTLQRAQIYLRVVHGPDGIDALDMPEDQPADNEVVHVYRRLGPARVMFMCGRGRGQRSGALAVADYEWLPDVDGEPLRDTSLVLKVRSRVARATTALRSSQRSSRTLASSWSSAWLACSHVSVSFMSGSTATSRICRLPASGTPPVSATRVLLDTADNTLSFGA